MVEFLEYVLTVSLRDVSAIIESFQYQRSFLFALADTLGMLVVIDDYCRSRMLFPLATD